MQDHDDARSAFAAWRDEFPGDPYASDAPLRALNRAHVADPARLEALEARAGAFGREVVSIIGPACERTEHRAHLPELQRWDGRGNRVETVAFDPAYHDIGRSVWGSGIVADCGTPGRAFEQATLLYLLSLEGEAGHACPAVCTIGLARALRRRAAPDVRDRFLPPLLEPDYDRTVRGSQFLTEVQGGSDVGANATTAEPVGDGSYLISGEKWFCSVIDAQQFLMTARVAGAPGGTRGLGCFVVDRGAGDGTPNGFSIRRLKEKLGTRGMASGELDLAGARAWPIGPVDEGFKTAVGIVLNTSRWMTAVGAIGMMRRAYLEAHAYARHRTAFGAPIAQFPLVRMTLARMRAEWLGALHAVWRLTALEDRVDAGTATDDDVLLHRLLVNVLKYSATVVATGVVRDGIEILGGNGAIEEFSVLPRLYRDSMVYESWEGSHNVLCAQVQRDLGRLDLAGALQRAYPQLGDAVVAPLRRAATDDAFGATHLRGALDRLAAAVGVAELRAAGHAAPATYLERTRLTPGYEPAADAEWLAVVDAVLSSEA